MEHPGWNPTQVMKLVNQAWNTLPKEERALFEEKSKKDRQRYEAEQADFLERKRETLNRERKDYLSAIK